MDNVLLIALITFDIGSIEETTYKHKAAQKRPPKAVQIDSCI